MTLPDYKTERTRRQSDIPERMQVDLCIVGSGVAGVSAALEAARLGKKVMLIDGSLVLGGQSVGAMIGTFAGLFSNGPDSHQITHGIADDFLRDLDRSGDLHYMTGRRNTTVVQYRVERFGRWIDQTVSESGITVLLGAVLRSVVMDGRRIAELHLATRYGDVVVRATGFVDASGDAALAWLAGLPLQQSADTPIYGSMMLSLEGVDDGALAALDAAAIKNRLRESAHNYGLERHDGFAFAFPGAGETLVNMTHLQTPLTITGYAGMVFEGRRQCDELLRFLKTEFSDVFGAARIRNYGMPGIRQGRWIVGEYTLTTEDVRSGRNFEDAVARCSWPIEIHDAAGSTADLEVFGDDHMHYVPLRSMLPAETDNLVAAGRCIDAEVLALASVRVMGCCIAMGAAAAHALVLAGDSPVHDIDIGLLRQQLIANLGR